MSSAEVELAKTFGDIARALLTEQDVDATLRKIVTIAMEVIDSCDHAGIDVVEDGKILPVAPSDDVAELIDKIQTEVGEGPCLSAIKEHEVFQSDDLEQEERWPTFSRRAFEETGVRSIMGFRLFAEERTMGALDLYSKQAHAFDDDTVALGSVLAVHASVALVHAQEREQFLQAIESRDIIGRAKGLLMAGSKIDDAQAFEMLRSASQRMNMKLRDVAKHIAHGEPLGDLE
ncbi:MAG TPA: GAF and ANTAR domain-containing protein [Acidimicrobiales bacterium]|nr:GAF and ANTAR domain-containing protein [Acidimicrobiales bacterium]